MSKQADGTKDAVTVTTVVEVAPADAFRAFTEDVDLWWKRGAAFRFGEEREGTLAFEGAAGGRLVLRFPAGEPFEVGRIRAWEPGRRLAFVWRDRTFVEGETTEVEVAFEPEAGGTRVTLTHRGWSSLDPRHRARHGLTGTAFTGLVGVRWGALVESLRARMTRPGPA